MGWWLFAAVVVGWGSTFFAIKLGLAGYTVLGLVASRNLLAAGAAVGLALARRESWPPLRQWPRIMALGLLLVAAGNLLTAAAQKTLSSGVAGLLNACISLWIVLLAARQERMPRRVWAGVALGLAGVALLLLPGDTIRMHPVGFLCMMGSTLGFSLGAMLQRQSPPAGGTFAILSLQMGATGLLAALLAWPLGGFTHGPLTATTTGALVFLAAVPSLLAFAAFAALSRLWAPSRFGIYAVLTPVVAVLLGSWLLKEPVTPRMLTAMGIILGGVALVQRR